MNKKRLIFLIDLIQSEGAYYDAKEVNLMILSLLCGLACGGVMSAHPVVDDCAPVRNGDAVDTRGHVVDDSPDLCVPLVSSWSVINEAACSSLSLNHGL